MDKPTFEECVNMLLQDALQDCIEAWRELKGELVRRQLPLPRLREFDSPAGRIAVRLMYGKTALWIGDICTDNIRAYEERRLWENMTRGYDPTHIKRMVETLRAYARYLRKRTECVRRAQRRST